MGKSKNKSPVKPSKGKGRANSKPDALNEMFVLRDQHGKPLAHFPYVVRLEDGRVIRGVTDKLGQAQRIYTGDKPLKATIGLDIQN